MEEEKEGFTQGEEERKDGRKHEMGEEIGDMMVFPCGQ